MGMNKRPSELSWVACMGGLGQAPRFRGWRVDIAEFAVADRLRRRNLDEKGRWECVSVYS